MRPERPGAVRAPRPHTTPPSAACAPESLGAVPELPPFEELHATTAAASDKNPKHRTRAMVPAWLSAPKPFPERSAGRVDRAALPSTLFRDPALRSWSFCRSLKLGSRQSRAVPTISVARVWFQPAEPKAAGSAVDFLIPPETSKARATPFLGMCRGWQTPTRTFGRTCCSHLRDRSTPGTACIDSGSPSRR